MNPLLEIRDVSLSYHTVSGETRALSHISFHLLPGEFLACRSVRLWKIHAFEPDLRSSSNRKGTILMNGTPPLPGDPASDICSRRIIFWNGGQFIEMFFSVLRFERN